MTIALYVGCGHNVDCGSIIFSYDMISNFTTSFSFKFLLNELAAKEIVVSEANPPWGDLSIQIISKQPLFPSNATIVPE